MTGTGWARTRPRPDTDHFRTLTTRHNLAHCRGAAGDPERAVAEFEALLADELRVHGPDHLSTLSTRHGLAVWRGEAGDTAGAVAEYEALLADRLRVLGPDDPDTLTTRDNLTHWREVAARGPTPGIDFVAVRANSTSAATPAAYATGGFPVVGAGFVEPARLRPT